MVRPLLLRRRFWRLRSHQQLDAAQAQFSGDSLWVMESHEQAAEEVTEEGEVVETSPSLELAYTRLSWEVERMPGPVQSAILAGFAAAQVESELMTDSDVSPRDRLAAAKQLRGGFMELCRLVGERRSTRPRSAVSSDPADPHTGTANVPDALGALYADEA